MKTPEAAKRERIVCLECCMETLLYKDNGYNEVEIRRLYTLIYRVICEMKELSAINAIDFFERAY